MYRKHTITVNNSNSKVKVYNRNNEESNEDHTTTRGDTHKLYIRVTDL
jgi:hypothetical protein